MKIEIRFWKLLEMLFIERSNVSRARGPSVVKCIGHESCFFALADSVRYMGKVSTSFSTK